MDYADPLTQLRLTQTTIQRARVLDVDTANYVCTVGTEFTQKPLTWVTWASPYEHHDNGEGMYMMPEVGSVCWLVEPSDGGMPFILGWTSIEDDYASHRHRKMDLNPGDIYLGTRDENHLWLRRGGVIQIGATPLCTRVFLPIDNIIRDFCENYLLQTLGGNLEWSVALAEKDSGNKQATTLSLKARQYADDAWPIALLQIGSHSNSEDTILTLAINDSGGEAPEGRLSITLDKTGEMVVKQTSPDITKKVLWDLTGNFEVTTPQQIKLESKLTARLASETLVEVEGKMVTITSLQDVVAVAAQKGMTIKKGDGSGALEVAGATHPVVLATDELIAFITSHTHVCAAAGADSDIPKTFPTAASIKSQDIKTS
jgi:hypothetical protein